MTEQEGHHTGAAEQVLRYDGGLSVGSKPELYVDLTGGRDRCVTYCLGQRQPVQRRRGQRCPSCYGKVGIRDMATEQDILPAGSRWSYLVAYWAGGWAAAWHDATVGMVRRPPGPGIWIPAPVICKGDFT